MAISPEQLAEAQGLTANYENFRLSVSLQMAMPMRDRIIAAGLPDPDPGLPALAEAEEARIAESLGEEGLPE